MYECEGGSEMSIGVPTTRFFGGGDYTAAILSGESGGMTGNDLHSGRARAADLAGAAAFQIFPGRQLPQSIPGLPLMNNYDTVFDRSLDPCGVIRFAPIKISLPSRSRRT
jgi:hypothetical protein